MSTVSTTHDHAHDHAHDDHTPHGWRRWLFATNHKDIGTMYLIFSFVSLLAGGVMALGIRLELFQPGLQFLRSEFFNQLTTMHGLVMVFGAIMPAFVGFANWMVPYPVLIGGIVGIWLLAGVAFAVNCLIEQAVDAKMKRTSWRPSATGEVTPFHIIIFSIILGSLGMVILWTFCNPLTMWLTLATFVGYAVIYTWLLKPATPQNIVIGGLSGAMPPALGWAAVT